MPLTIIGLTRGKGLRNKIPLDLGIPDIFEPLQGFPSNCKEAPNTDSYFTLTVLYLKK